MPAGISHNKKVDDEDLTLLEEDKAIMKRKSGGKTR
jgi:hypothetical protein